MPVSLHYPVNMENISPGKTAKVEIHGKQKKYRPHCCSKGRKSPVFHVVLLFSERNLVGFGPEH